MATKDSLADTIKAQWPKDTLISRLRASLVFEHRDLARIRGACAWAAHPGACAVDRIDGD